MALAHELVQQMGHLAGPVVARGWRWPRCGSSRLRLRGGFPLTPGIFLPQSQLICRPHQPIDADVDRIAQLAGGARGDATQCDGVVRRDKPPYLRSEGEDWLRLQPPGRIPSILCLAHASWRVLAETSAVTGNLRVEGKLRAKPGAQEAHVVVHVEHGAVSEAPRGAGRAGGSSSGGARLSAGARFGRTLQLCSRAHDL